MRYLAVLSLIVSLAAAAWLGFEIHSLRSSIARVNAEALPPAPESVGRMPSSVAPSAHEAPVRPSPSPLPRIDGSPATADGGERWARIERRLSSLEATTAMLVDGIAQRGLLLPGALVLRDVETASEVLGLDAGRKSNVEHARQEAVARIQELYRTPNEDGLTWDQVADRRIVVPGFGDAPAVATADAAAIRRFEESRVPGGGTETYAEARGRLLREGLTRVRATLDSGQQALWDRASTEALVRVEPGSASAPPPAQPPPDSERPGATSPK